MSWSTALKKLFSRNSSLELEMDVSVPHSVFSASAPKSPIKYSGDWTSPGRPCKDAATFPEEEARNSRNVHVKEIPSYATLLTTTTTVLEDTNQDGNIDNNLSHEVENALQRKLQFEEEQKIQEVQMKKLEKLLSKSNFYSQLMAKKLEKTKSKKTLPNKNESPTNAHKSPVSSLPKLGTRSRESFYRKSKLGVKTATQTLMSSPSKSSQSSSEGSQPDRQKPKRGQKRNYEQDADKCVSDDTGVADVEQDEAPEGHPKLFTGGKLKDYQLEGYRWLRSLHENGANGILADEMGLGKTVQCIAMVAQLIEDGLTGPYLICAPVSVLYNWAREFARFTPKIPFIVYHGTKTERDILARRITLRRCGAYKTYPVVLTSYQIVMNDLKMFQTSTWKYLVIDEGQRIKNTNCLFNGALKGLKSRNRLLMTGTPLQNNLSELWSLLNFLLPDLFDDLELFNSWFDVRSLGDDENNYKIVAQEREQQLLSKFHQILDPFLLRRLKIDVEVNLPPKRELLVYAPMTARQRELYKALADYTIADMITTEKEKELGEIDTALTERGRPQRKCNMGKKMKMDYDHVSDDQYLEDLEKELEAPLIAILDPIKPVATAWHIRMQNRLMQFRKCVNHPYLLQCPLEPGTPYRLVDENLVLSSGKMLVVDLLLLRLKERGHKVLIFSQFTSFLNILEDFCQMRKYRYSRLDGSTRFIDREIQVDQFMSDPSVFIFLLSTKAGGLGLTLTAADTVIIVDSDWNPQNDLQAMDRCHRIGQVKPVVIYRLATHNTIDQVIVERAAAKRKLEKIVIPKDKFKSISKNQAPLMDLDELLKILKSHDHDRVIDTADGNLFSNEELEMILDRSDMTKSQSSAPKDSPRMFKVLDEECGVVPQEIN